MSTYRLDHLFAPRSVALVGASPRQGSLGNAMLRNLRDAGFPGPLDLVNPRYPEIDGLPVVKSLRDLAGAPDVVVVADRPIGSGGHRRGGRRRGRRGDHRHCWPRPWAGVAREACEAAARAKGLRLVGPNCLGILAPRARLNASFAARMPRSGDLALISQSGAIAAGMVEWAAERGIGFSAIASIGDQIDVDVGDLLDYFALDRATRAILLYVELVSDARKFMSAARAAARIKPVVVDQGRPPRAGAKAAATHTGALAGSDAVYDAAFRRAGLLRVLRLRRTVRCSRDAGPCRAPLPASGWRSSPMAAASACSPSTA